MTVFNDSITAQLGAGRLSRPSPATYLDDSGTLFEVAANVPRIVGSGLIFEPVGAVNAVTNPRFQGAGNFHAGTPAIVQAIVTGGVVTGFNILAPGDGYTVAPTIGMGNPGSGFVGTVQIAGGRVVGITITNGGTGYAANAGSCITGGTLPTGYFWGGNGSQVGGNWGRSIVGVTTRNGMPQLVVRLTAAGAGTTEELAWPSSGQAAIQGDVRSQSSFIELIAGSMTGITTIGFSLYESPTNASLGLTLTSQFTAAGGAFRRYSNPNRTVAQATTTALGGRWNLSGTNYDITLGFSAPQVEPGAVVTTPVFPSVGTVAASTRAAEVLDDVVGVAFFDSISTPLGLGVLRRASRASYINDAGNLVEVTADVPRYVGGGLLFEPTGTTNQVRDPRLELATPGAAASASANLAVHPHWATFASSGLTMQCVGRGVMAGITYVDVRFLGTSTATFFVFVMEAGQVSVNGDAWAQAVFLALPPGGALGAVTGVSVNPRTSGALNPFTSALPLSEAWKRVGTLAADAGNSGGTLWPGLGLGFATGVAVDTTLRIGGLQFSKNDPLGIGASLVLPPAGTPGASTRAPEVLDDLAALTLGFFDTVPGPVAAGDGFATTMAMLAGLTEAATANDALAPQAILVPATADALPVGDAAAGANQISLASAASAAAGDALARGYAAGPAISSALTGGDFIAVLLGSDAIALVLSDAPAARLIVSDTDS